jgi:hypothetical protein
MSGLKSPTAARAIVDEVLGRSMTREIWTGNYDKALPITVNDFDLGAMLPAIFYMFRFGYRRGKGRFEETFGADTGTDMKHSRKATIERVADRLSRVDAFAGFDGEVKRAVLGDLLLCFCLENRNRALGRREQIQRVAPAHYMASWVDLPKEVANLRFVPEMIVALLADQAGDCLEQSRDGDRTWFAVGQGYENNILLQAFNQGMSRKGVHTASKTADRFHEDADVGLDQLLMIRLAQQLGTAPEKTRGTAKADDRIRNQRPIAEHASLCFSEDLRRFTRSYSRKVPRLTFVELLESCMAVGLTTIVTETIELLLEWAATGVIRKKREQRPPGLFVDGSNGMNRQLRALAEQSLDDLIRRIERFPVVLMVLRLLDHGARFDPQLKKLEVPTRPYATEWLDLLGDLLFGRRAEARDIHNNLERKALELAERLDEEDPNASELLRNDKIQPHPVWRMAEALTLLQGRKSAQNNVMSLVDSALLVNRPNGLATKRADYRKDAPGGARKKRDTRSLVLTDPVLDYLVHLHVLNSGSKDGYRRLSFREFLAILRDRHGFYVETSPPNLPISNDLLRANRTILERRLRDLGLLVGVNDAEAMKHLEPRFESPEGNHGLD